MESSNISEEETPAEVGIDEFENLVNENFVDIEIHQRLKADFDNYRRRTEAERLKRDEQIVSDFVENLLPVLEAFEAGMEYDSETLKPVYSLFSSILENAGLSVINPESDEVFDPALHEAVGVSDAEEEEEVGSDSKSIVKEVVRIGYLWGEKLLRPAQVKVE